MRERDPASGRSDLRQRGDRGDNDRGVIASDQEPTSDDHQGQHPQKQEEEGKRDNRPRGDKHEKHDKHDKNDKHHKRNEQHHDTDVNSWKYKFHNREPKKYDKIVFTAETEIPALPPKEARLKQPSKEDLDAEMAKIDAKINEIREKKKHLVNKKAEIQQGGKMTGSQLTYKEAMNAKINENKKTKSEQSKLLEAVRNINGQLE